MTTRIAEDLGARLGHLRKRLEPIERLGEKFLLSRFEQDVLLLAAFPEFEADGGSWISAAQGEAHLTRPTVALALSALPDAHWSAFSSTRPLRGFGLVELEGPGITACTDHAL